MNYRGHECPAMFCERRVPRVRFMCADHWFKIPIKLRNRINRLWADVGPLLPLAGELNDHQAAHLLAYRVARQLAVRAVAMHEGFGDRIVSLPEGGLHDWRLARANLRDELGRAYDGELQPYRDRLKRLMELSAGDDPIEVAAIAIRVGVRGEGQGVSDEDRERDKRRMAAAIDLVEGAGAR